MFMSWWRGDQAGQTLFSRVQSQCFIQAGDITQRRRFPFVWTHECDFQLREDSELRIAWLLGTLSSESITSLQSSLQGHQQWGHRAQGVITQWESFRKWIWHPLKICKCLPWRRTGISWLVHKPFLLDKDGPENLKLYPDFFFLFPSFLLAQASLNSEGPKQGNSFPHPLLHLVCVLKTILNFTSAPHAVPRQPGVWFVLLSPLTVYLSRVFFIPFVRIR